MRAKVQRWHGLQRFLSFYIALLAKQGLQLQQGKKLCFYRVFKNKYFHDEEFIDAKRGHHQSLAWRSIRAARSLIRDGIKWQVENGHSINIRKDKWINTPSTFLIVSPQKLLPMEATVCILIDAENGEWKVSMIRDVFLEHEDISILIMLHVVCMLHEVTLSFKCWELFFVLLSCCLDYFIWLYDGFLDEQNGVQYYLIINLLLFVVVLF